MKFGPGLSILGYPGKELVGWGYVGLRVCEDNISMHGGRAFHKMHLQISSTITKLDNLNFDAFPY